MFRTSPGPMRSVGRGGIVANAELAGTIPLWQWIGDEGATTFSY